MESTGRQALGVRVLMQGLMLALQEIAKEDDAIQEHLRGWNRIIQYTVMPDGPHVHVAFEDGRVTPGVGEHGRANAVIRFADLDTALAIFRNRLDPQTAFMQGKVQMTGDMADAMKMALLAQMVSKYLR